MRSRQARATASHVVRPLPIAAVISNALSSFKDASGFVAALALIAYLSGKYDYVIIDRAVSDEPGYRTVKRPSPGRDK
jgi:7-keto-8-aminopelargonate synthetase-like enzyme